MDDDLIGETDDRKPVAVAQPARYALRRTFRMLEFFTRHGAGGVDNKREIDPWRGIAPVAVISRAFDCRNDVANGITFAPGEGTVGRGR